MAVEVIDYNKDGLQDIVIGNERGQWHLFKNNLTSDRSFITVEVGNAPSGKATGLGATVSLKTCGSKQTQHVGASGAAYSLSHDQYVHFGIGTCTTKATITVTWTNGESKTISVESFNKTILVGKRNK